MPEKWVDFKAIKDAVSMQMVLEHYEVKGLKRVGEDLRGPCPIHMGAPSSKHLSVNLTKNAFKCFERKCRVRGNILDFVAAVEDCSVRDAALKLRDLFKVGESGDVSKECENGIWLSAEALESLRSLFADLEALNAKLLDVKEIVAKSQKEV